MGEVVSQGSPPPVPTGGPRARNEPQLGELVERYPALADMGSKDDAQRIGAFQHVLDQLQHELDESGD